MRSSSIKTVFVAFLSVTIAGFIFFWFGMFNVAANVKHWDITTTFLEWVRERSINSNVEELAVPDIRDKQLIANGAGNYGAMCAQCHLAPGVETSEMHKGLNPQPPAFHKGKMEKRDPRATYWIINNGIKMTGMAAWGDFHTDQQVWELVAFVNALPGMSAGTYKNLVGEGKHAHAGGGDDHGANMPEQMKRGEDHHAPATSLAPVAPIQGINGGQATLFRQNAGHHPVPAGGSVPGAPMQSQNMGQPSPFSQNTGHHAPTGGSAPAAPVQSQYFEQSSQLLRGGSGHHGSGSKAFPVNPGQSQSQSQYNDPSRLTDQAGAAGSPAGAGQSQNNTYQPNGHVNNQGYQDSGHGYQGSNHGYQNNSQGYQGNNHGNQNYNQGYQGSNHNYQNNGHGYQNSGHGYQNNGQGYLPYGSQPYDSQYYGTQQPQGYQQSDHGHHYQQ